MSNTADASLTPNADAIRALAAKLGRAWEALMAADATAPQIRVCSAKFQAAFDALATAKPATPEGKRAQLEALAPHYLPAGGLSDRVAAAAFAALGVDLMAHADFQRPAA